MYTMGDIARMSINNEELLFKLFGVNAEILIDHAWGVEPCTLKIAKEYIPLSNSKSVGQVLHYPYDFEKTKIVLREMIDDLTLYLVSRKLVTNQVVLTVGYDISSLDNSGLEVAPTLIMLLSVELNKALPACPTAPVVFP